ncbi:hypothetical protein LCGC14_0840940 [marine sediment metagenome]|uniref:Transposase IS66 C-terminal domain-containing protein n=1 Tax=marine sediment metagenome TaxID=412755 RepID=A0A0F9RXT8_9ZZZZ
MAIAFTLIGTAKLNKIDPQAWLACVLAQIADHKITRLDERMPWRDAAQEAQQSRSCPIAPSFSIISRRARLS